MAFLNLLNSLSQNITMQNIEQMITLVEKLIELADASAQHVQASATTENNNPPQNCSASGS